MQSNGTLASSRAKKAEYMRRWRVANPAAARANDRRQDARKDPAAKRATKRRWAERNPDAVRVKTLRWQAANPDRVRAAQAKYRAVHRAEVLATKKARRLANLGALRAADRARYAQGPERGRANTRKYRAVNPELTRAAVRNARANAFGGGVITSAEWAGVLELYAGRCAYCLNRVAVPEQDHVIPLATGGTHSIDNVVPTCGRCNKSKGNRGLLAWLLRRRAA